MAYIDFHAHLHPTEEARERLLLKMEALGIVKTVVVAGGVLPRNALLGRPTNVPAPNQKVYDLCQKSDGKLLPFYFANPFEEPQEYRAHGEKYFGTKLGPIVHGVALNDPRYTAYLHLSQEFHHPVYLHCLPREGFDVPALLRLAKSHPKISFILGHAGIGNCDFLAVDLIKNQKNISFETSGGFSSVISYAVKTLGISRILFGTEYPLQAPEIELEKMRCLDLAPVLLNQNAQRLLEGMP